MKKVLITISLLFSLVSNSQSITVNTTTYSVPQLVTDVLVNRPCVIVNNITSRTGTNFGSTNGIGYFTNTNPAFPLSSGVILSTGNVNNAPGPNTTQLNDGNTVWVGDANLEATLLSAGITMNSTNATVLEFDFTPFSPNFNFQFLFASEEYGNFQCQFSDAFAFLLTDTTTGVTTNLAVVPSTNLPISVVTIRDFLYNSSCPSANAQYFGAFNGGSSAAASATNFNGQTTVLNASSTLVPNRQYHIKLVIADRQDSSADSAIFLGANSFNIGQDVLGEDLTVASNTAICDGQNYTITSGLDPTVYSFAWTFNGNPIGGNTANLTINQPGTYSLTYTIISTSCTVTTDFKFIEYFNALSIPDPVNLNNCSAGQPTYTFDLSYNTPIVATTPGNIVSYYASLADANANTNLLPLSYTVPAGNLPVTIWVRIQNTATGCFFTKTFQLQLAPPPVANSPGTYRLCETTTGGGTATFNLVSQNNTVLGGQSPTIYGVSYYTTVTDANAGTNAIDLSAGYDSSNATIYVRVQNNTQSNCFSVNSFNLVVIPNPIIVDLPDQYVCLNYTLPPLPLGNYFTGPNGSGTMLNAGDIIAMDSNIYIYYATPTVPSCNSQTSFEVIIVDITDVTPTNTAVCDTFVIPAYPFPGTQYFTQAGGPGPTNTELLPGNQIATLGTTTLYVYFTFTDISCPPISAPFTITVNATPVITGSFNNVFDCTSYNLPPLAVGNYYTYDSDTDIYTVATSPITSTTTLYVFATNGICRTTNIVFTTYIGTLGIANVNECLSYTLPVLPIGEYRDSPNGGGNIIPAGTAITATSTIYTFVPGASCTNDDFFTITISGPPLSDPTPVTTCASYTLPVQVDSGLYYTLPGGPTVTGNVQLFANTSIITTTTSIYIYKDSSTPGCYNEKSWLITINQRPIIDSRADVEQCNYYDLTPLNNGSYYDDPLGVNPLAAGTRITSNNTIYIFAANASDPSCFSQNSFNVVINGVEADAPPAQLIYCDRFVFPTLSANNFYYDAPGGPIGGGNIIPAGTIVTSANLLPIYYIYYETGNRLNCSDENPFSIIINNTPIANAPTHLNSCDTFGASDGVFAFDLRVAEAQVLGSQNAADFVFSYFTSQSDANNPNATAIANPSAYENDTPLSDSVWIRISNNVTTGACFAVTQLQLSVRLLPEPQLNSEYFICNDFETGALNNPVTINSGLVGTNYSYVWRKDGVIIGGNTASISAIEIGTYSVIVTDNATGCDSEPETTEVKSYVPYIEVIYSDAFETATFVTINVLGAGTGEYEYQLDDSGFQDSNVFYNITPGSHTVSVRDKSGLCSPAPLTIEFINYPKFFTPNGDGYNETWNLPHLKVSNPNAPISIFDRMGKLVKQITPSTEGWNGFFNGQPLPATDYWFSVDYTEKGAQKTFKAHFSLKR